MPISLHFGSGRPQSTLDIRRLYCPSMLVIQFKDSIIVPMVLILHPEMYKYPLRIHRWHHQETAFQSLHLANHHLLQASSSTMVEQRQTPADRDAPGIPTSPGTGGCITILFIADSKALSCNSSLLWLLQWEMRSSISWIDQSVFRREDRFLFQLDNVCTI